MQLKLNRKNLGQTFGSSSNANILEGDVITPAGRLRLKQRGLLQNRFPSIVRFSCAGALISASVVSAILALPLSTTGSNPPQPQVIDDSQMQAQSMTIG